MREPYSAEFVAIQLFLNICLTRSHQNEEICDKKRNIKKLQKRNFGRVRINRKQRYVSGEKKGKLRKI